MSKNYAALAQQIVAAIGGVDNVAAVTHCMTVCASWLKTTYRSIALP
ncbi:PTS system cellobiose/arbutin/salicin-specific transporter subunits IIBC [Klebsiella pneumoniae]|nr:PTS system cellobiose/arbutin/salicin-specific transporter subunits IIBC [Klebsiella pneumoniae]